MYSGTGFSPSVSPFRAPPSAPLNFPCHVSRLPCSDITKIASFTLDKLLEAHGGDKAALYSVSASPVSSNCPERNTNPECFCWSQACPHRAAAAASTHPLPLHPELPFDASPFRDKSSLGAGTALHTAAAGASVPHFARCTYTPLVTCQSGAAAACAPRSAVVESLFPLPQRELCPGNKSSRQTSSFTTFSGLCDAEHPADCAGLGAAAPQRVPGNWSAPNCGAGRRNGRNFHTGNLSHDPCGEAAPLHVVGERRGACAGDASADQDSEDPLSLHFSSQTHSGARHLTLNEERGPVGTRAKSHGHFRFLVAVGGIPGSGKSTFGGRLAAEIKRLWSERRKQWEEERRCAALASPVKPVFSAESATEQEERNCFSSPCQEVEGDGARTAEASASETGRRDTSVKPCDCAEILDGAREKAKQEKDICVAIGMDGFHLTREQLSQFPDPAEAFRRRGAAWTFDMPAFWRTLHDVKYSPDRSISLPTFDHSTKDPVPDGIIISPETKIVIVEGLYLCLSENEQEKEETVASIETPKRCWFNQDDNLFDVQLFLHTPLEEAGNRVVKRHLASGICDTETEAVERWNDNDAVNAAFILSHVDTAHLNAAITQD
ncbi:uridine kinase [Toxoplasma gondii GT1]|uniref:Uridine kinase n=3 Tax=Toxoplasma gondii TaxID=5811 RepID=S7ULZ9_TOXGG|nr:uridine kinase [Toxoplasma gondii GT1]KAF4639767.1 uridine kinase [Toxoplasma gondii]RQX67138.1 uridine kinase [Toxoplasma gondii CAST]